MTVCNNNSLVNYFFCHIAIRIAVPCHSLIAVTSDRMQKKRIIYFFPSDPLVYCVKKLYYNHYNNMAAWFKNVHEDI